MAKKQSLKTSAIAAWECTRPLLFLTEGTLVTLRPCLHFAASQRLPLRMMLSAHARFALRTAFQSVAEAMSFASPGSAEWTAWAAASHSASHQGEPFCYVLAQMTSCQSDFESDNDEGA